MDNPKDIKQITWTNGKRKLSELTPWDRNPRQIRKEQAERLEESLEQFGQIHPIAIDPDNMVIDGHQRDLVWSASEKFGNGFEVDVRIASRKLTEKEREKLTIFLHEGTAGEWNMDELANWDMQDLDDWGFDLESRGLVLPDDNEWGEAFSGLPDEDRAPFQQMTFTMHDLQVETVKEALAASKALGDFVGTENENSNGNALARICEIFLEAHGQG